MNMRLLWLTENYPPRRGGMAQACDRIVDNLRKSGIEIDIAHFSQTTSSKVIQQQNGRLFNIPAIEGPGHSLNCFYNLISSSEYKTRYTHIVAFGGYLPILALPIFKCWLEACAITLLRGNDFDLGIFSPSRRQILFDALDASSVVSVLSSDQRQKLAHFIDEDKIFTIFNGIDCKDWHADPTDMETAQNWRKENVEQQRKVVGLIGQLKAKKGGTFFLGNVLSANLEEKFHFLLIGDIAEEMAAWLEEKKDRLSYTRLEFLDRWELLSWYPACDFIALPSFYDGMPNVLLEAGALGIPVIAARAGGIPDVLGKDFSNFSFHPGDKHGCRAALWNIANLDSEKRNEVGKLLKSRIESDFNSEKETEEYIRLLGKAHGSSQIGFMKT